MKTFTRSAFLVVSLWLVSGTAAAEKFYCCKDDNGKKTCGDILPSVCIGRAYHEVGANGQIIRHIRAPLTPEERAKLAAEAEQRRAQEERDREQQRKDTALLATYSSENDIELTRESVLADASKAISNAENRIAEIRSRRQKFEEQAASLKKGNIPPEVQKGLDDTAQEINIQEDIISLRKNEIIAIKTKYDGELQHYRRIKEARQSQKK
ncbi:MAG: hypothetical protein LBD67_01410 [Candidatus Accumulibacter sp.]|nr:hypothetical protein [Accumulibacter sp.]